MWSVTPRNIRTARAAAIRSSDFGVLGTQRFGRPDAKSVVAVSAQVYGGELNGYAAAYIFGKYPEILGTDTQICFISVRNTDKAPRSNLNRLPIHGDFSEGDFPRAEELRRALSEVPVKFSIDVEENSDPEHHSGWLLSTSAGTSVTETRLLHAMPHTVVLRGITTEQERTGSRPFGTILSCPGMESLTRPGDVKAALRAVFCPLVNLGLLVDTVECEDEEREQNAWDAIGIVQVPDRTKTFNLIPKYLKPFVYAQQGEVLGISSDNTTKVVMPCDGYLVLCTKLPQGSDPFFYVVRKSDQYVHNIRVPVGL